MAKTVVLRSSGERSKVPFLRGILTSSLSDAGVPIEEAYSIATKVREKLDDRAEVTTAEVREIVLRYISDYGAATKQRYTHPATVSDRILVRDASGQITEFSRRQYRRVLESSGLSQEDANSITAKIFLHLVERGITEVHRQDLGRLTYRYLRRVHGPRAARDYLVLVNFLRGEQPLLVLIGGATGTGKSALATEIAQRLEIVRTQSSDLLREVMRMMIPKRLLPVLHKSSYDAWQVLPAATDSQDMDESLLIDGYLAQADLLEVPCEAVIRRSLQEGSSLVLEGVHVRHSMVDMVPKGSNAIAVPIVLAALSPDGLRDRFKGRGEQVGERRSERYLQNFEAIWRLQSYLLSEADKKGIPIIVGNHREQVIIDVMKTIVQSLSTHLIPEPSEVFS